MKKLFTICVAILVASVLFSGCGRAKSEIDVKLRSTDVKGVLSDYFKVVNGTYKLFTLDKEAGYEGKYFYQIKVQVKRTEKKFDFNSVDLTEEDSFKIICTLFDEQEVPVITAAREGYNGQGRNSEDAALVALKPGETGWAIFSFWGDKRTMNKGKKIEVDSYLKQEQAENNTTTSSEVAEKQ